MKEKEQNLRDKFQEEAQAFAGLVQAMYDTNTVAIVRRCFSERSAPELGFLRPHIAHDHIVGRHVIGMNECLIWFSVCIM